MKKIGMKNIIRKVTVAAVLLMMLVGVSIAALTPIAEASSVPTLDSMLMSSFNIGTVGISDPTRVETGEGYYMVPTSYVYLGEVYNASTRRYESVICRVLDNDKDNTGAEGAMLLYTENAIEPSRFYPRTDGYELFVGTENIYLLSALKDAGDKYFLGSHYGSNFEDVPEPEDFLVPITKSDYKADFEGLFEDFLASIDYKDYPQLEQFGDHYLFYFETDAPPADGDPLSPEAVKSDKADNLVGSLLFQLSVGEFHQYMGSLSKSDYYKSQYILTGEDVSYWLRTGIYEYTDLREAVADNAELLEGFIEREQSYLGNIVVGVGADGSLVDLPAEAEGVYGRFALNLATDAISYNRVIDGVHKLAFTDPRYASLPAFTAEVVNTEDGVVTLKYSGAIRSRSTVWYGEDEVEYLSVMIKGEDGRIKSYASIAEIPQCYYEKDEEKISSEEFTAQFALPDDYDETTDTIVVFWERKNSLDERMPSYTSNMVELNCAHTYYADDGSFVSLPTCTALGSCAICGESFGELDGTNHPNLEGGDYVYDDAAATHRRVCPDCGREGPSEACTFVGACNIPCKCGNYDENSENHNFPSDGICTRNEAHYQPPEISMSGKNVIFRVKNVGNWLWVAEFIAKGEFYYAPWEEYSVYIDDDLDFSGKAFKPLGTEEHPFRGEVDSLGRRFTISGIDHSDPEADALGIISYAENVTITNLYISGISFEGSGAVGALVGKAKNVDVEGVIIDGSIELASSGGSVGAYFGSADADSSLLLSFSYPTVGDSAVYYTASGVGTPVNDTSFFLAAEDGEGGYISADTFASGFVSYTFNQRRPGIGWRQTVTGDERDPYPTRNASSLYVRITEYCDGTPAVYTNNKKDEMIHYPVEVYGFEWGFAYAYCDADVFCGKCNQRILTPAVVEIVNEYPKATYTASTTLVSGEVVKSDPVVFYGATLEDFIGISPVTLTYNGGGIYPEHVMTNHALHESEFDAYFVNSDTGEKYMYEDYGEIYSEPIYNVGTYDLVVVGRQGDSWDQVGGNWTEDNIVHRYPRNFSGQTATYERILTITPAEVTVTPRDVFKHEDGDGRFAPSWTIDNEQLYAGDFDVVYSEAPSALVGDYTLSVSVTSRSHGDNVIITLAKNTVTGSIIEKRNVYIQNVDYPTVFTYGDVITAPTADSFDMTPGAAFSYEWFELVENYNAVHTHLVPVDEPKNAGKYVLRAYAGSVGSLGASYVDVNVRINPAELTVEYVLPADVETTVYYHDTYYLIDSLDEIGIRLTGFVNGDSESSLGISVKAALSDNVDLDSIDFDPARINHYLTFEVIGDTPNYAIREADSQEDIKVSLPGIGLPEIIEEEYSYDYENVGGIYEEVWGFRYSFSWSLPVVDGFELDRNAGQHWRYAVTIYDISYGVENKIAVKHFNVGRGDRLDENALTVRTKKAGSFLITIVATATEYYGNQIELPGVENNEVITEIYFNIGINERADGDVDEIGDIGCYTVTVSSFGSLEDYDSGEPAKVTSHEFYLAKEIQMFFKEVEYNISDRSFNFDIADIYKHVIMEAGGVFRLGHKLVDVEFYVNTNPYNTYYYPSGYAKVTAFTVVDELGNDVSYLYVPKDFDTDLVDHLGGGIGTAHIFDTPCDTECNIDGCGYTRAVGHAGDASGEGSCHKAYICEICGAAYEPEEPRHTSSETVIFRCGEDVAYHEVVYTCCGEVAYREAHYGGKATCKTLAVCEGCGRSYGELDPTNHEETSTCQSVSDSEHKISYPCCGDSYNEAHFGGEATCKAKAVCEGCGAGYGDVDPDNHLDEIEAEVDPDNPDMHIKVYICCGVSTDEAHFGGEATCESKAVCEACGTTYGETDKENHTSDTLTYEINEENASMHDAFYVCCGEYAGKRYHEGGTASCTSGAICEACGAAYGDVDPTNHESDKFVYLADGVDPATHLKLYACCGEEAERSAHTFGEADCIVGAVCTLCTMADGNLGEHKYPNDCAHVCEVCNRSTRAESFHTDANGDEACDVCGEHTPKQGISGGAISGIVTGSTVALGVGGFSLFWFVLKKKSWMELIGFFK